MCCAREPPWKGDAASQGVHPQVQLGNKHRTQLRRTAALPGDLVDQPALQQQVSVGEQAVTDEVLVGAHGHAVTQGQGRQHLQHLGVPVTVSHTRHVDRVVEQWLEAADLEDMTRGPWHCLRESKPLCDVTFISTYTADTYICSIYILYYFILYICANLCALKSLTQETHLGPI